MERRIEIFFIILGIIWFIMIPVGAGAAIYLIVAAAYMAGMMQLPVYLDNCFLVWFSAGQITIAMALIVFQYLINRTTRKVYRKCIHLGCYCLPLRNF